MKRFFTLVMLTLASHTMANAQSFEFKYKGEVYANGSTLVINAETDMLVALKEQIHDVISTVEDANESMILQYRYVQGRSWESIAALLNVDISTAYRWHAKALQHVKMPEQPIKI